jgi:hypothetical protein
MNTRERILAMIVLGIVIVLGLGFLFKEFVYAALDDRKSNIERLRSSVAAKQTELLTKEAWMAQTLKDKPRLAYWRQLSLPLDTDMSKRDHQKFLSELMRRYENYLSDLLKESGFSAYRISSKATENKGRALAGAKATFFTPVTVTVDGGHADLRSVVKMMERFYRTSLLHQIKNVQLQRPQTARQGQRPNELDVKLTIEAIVVTGAEDRMTLLPQVDRRLVLQNMAVAFQGGPSGLVLVPWFAGLTGPLGPRVLADPSRQYASIAGKDIFFGRAATPATARSANPFDSLQHVFLTDITHSPKGAEAFLYVRFSNGVIRLRASAGFDRFRIRDSEGDVMLSGKVTRINDRDLVFSADERHYLIHVGQSVKEAMEKPLKEEQVKALEKSTP